MNALPDRVPAVVIGAGPAGVAAAAARPRAGVGTVVRDKAHPGGAGWAGA